MRGKVAGFYDFVACFRITPAYAGKRSMFTKSFTEHGDHPRVCGEKIACHR